MHLHLALAERIIPQKFTEAAKVLLSLKVLSYKTVPWLSVCKKVPVKYKSPSNETQPEASLDLDQLNPSSAPTSCITGQSKHSTLSPRLKQFNASTLPAALRRHHIGWHCYRKGRKLHTIKTCDANLVRMTKTFSLKSHQKVKKRIMILIITAAVIN